MYVVIFIVGLLIALSGGFFAYFKGKKVIGYILLAAGGLIMILTFPYLPKEVEGAITGSYGGR
jgi:hypothetical protein